MFHIKQEQSDHLEQSSLRPSTSRLQEQYHEVSPCIMKFSLLRVSIYLYIMPF